MKKIILIFCFIFIIIYIPLISSASDSQEIKITTEIPYQYTVKIINNGNGTVFGNNLTITNSITISCSRFSDLNLRFSPDDGYKISKVIVNDKDMTYSVHSDILIIKKITLNYTVEVSFEKDYTPKEITNDNESVLSSIYSKISDEITEHDYISDSIKTGYSIYDFIFTLMLLICSIINLIAAKSDK